MSARVGRLARAVVALAVVVVALALAARRAAADTLVLVDVPPAVEQALRASLAPWGVELVIAPAPPSYDPRAVASEHQAGFVVWRRARSLHLYDAALAAEEERPLPADGDDAGAAAVALSIKTWMGLGPPPGGACGLADCPRPPARRWLVEAGLGVRAAPAATGGAGFRYGLAVGHRRDRFEVGLRLDLGVAGDGTAFGRDGSWSTWSLGAWARADLRVTPSLAVLPGLGLGLVDVAFSAPRLGPMVQAIDTSDRALGIDVEVGGRWQRGRLAVGARLGATIVTSDLTLQDKQLEEVVGAHVEPFAQLVGSVHF